MTTTTQNNTAAQLCLQQFGMLQLELETAIDALSRNALTDFEHSLWQQEMLSTGLRRSLALLGIAPIDQKLRAELRSAAAALQKISRTYQAVIEQGGRSAALLHGVCSLHQAGPQHTTHTQQALSCEA